MNHLTVWGLILVGAAPVLAGDWPQFRGPGGSGVSAESVPVQWSQTENLRWKVPLPGRGLSSPVSAGRRLFLTACSGYQQSRLHVLCLDSADGHTLWERQFWATGNTLCHDKTCMAAPTPATDGDQVYALFATGDLVCLTVAGDLVWYRSLAGDYPTIGNNVGMAASPIVEKDTLLVPMENAGDSFVAGIDTHTGANRWKVHRPREINWVTPYLLDRGDRAEALFQSRQELTAYEPRTGKKLWSYSSGNLSTIPSPVAAHGLVLAPGGGLVALRPGMAGTAPEVAWKSAKLPCATATPLCFRDRVYTLNGAGVLICGASADGSVLWQQRLKGKERYSASPIAADGKIYLVNEDGLTNVVLPGPQPQILAANPLEETILATPTVADGALFLRSDQHLYCIAAKSGK